MRYLQHGNVKSDLDLINSRFRLACFLQFLLATKPGTPLLISDYTDCLHYRLVEEFCPIKQTEGLKEVFRMPEEVNQEVIGKMEGL